jgi:hypothetical protein
MKTLAEAISTYDLPAKEILEAEHGTITIEDDQDIMVELIKELREKIAKYLSFIEGLVQPDSDMTELLESSQFSEKEREDMYQLYRELMAMHRAYYLEYLTFNPQTQANYYKKLLSLWIAKKEQVRLIVTKALGAWSEDQSLKEAKQSYLG